MHIAEGILPIRHAAFWGSVAVPFVIWSWRKVRQILGNKDPTVRASLGMAFSFAFAATVFPVPVPAVGVSSHICFTPLLAFLLGPTTVVFPTMVILLIQAIFFAHGGLTTLGANVFTLGVIAPFGAWGLAKILTRLRIPPVVIVGLVGFISDLAVYLADSCILAFAFQGERSFGYWFKIVALGFAPGQVPLAILEGILSAYLFNALFKRRAELIPSWIRPGFRSKVLQAGAVAVFCCLFFLSGSSASADGPKYNGLDEVVIEATAHAAGKPASPPLLPVDQGDLGLFVWGVGGFISGLGVGVNWMKLKADKVPCRESRS